MPERERERPQDDEPGDDEAPERGQSGQSRKPRRNPADDIIERMRKDDTLEERQRQERDRVNQRKEKSGE